MTSGMIFILAYRPYTFINIWCALIRVIENVQAFIAGAVIMGSAILHNHGTVTLPPAILPTPVLYPLSFVSGDLAPHQAMLLSPSLSPSVELESQISTFH